MLLPDQCSWYFEGFQKYNSTRQNTGINVITKFCTVFAWTLMNWTTPSMVGLVCLISQNRWDNGRSRKLSVYITEGRKHDHDFSLRSWVASKSVLKKSDMDGKLISSSACPLSTYAAVFPNRKKRDGNIYMWCPFRTYFSRHWLESRQQAHILQFPNSAPL